MMAPLLLTGSNGQLGSTFQSHWPQSNLSARYQLNLVDIQQLDLTDETAVNLYLDALKPQVIINGAAYTAVDKAETERESAFVVNELAAGYLARWCASNNAFMLQISTDFVFDGDASDPYATSAPASPLSVYGASKLAGEKAVQKFLPERSAIIRTSWLYSEYGNNYVKTMLRLMQERDELGIVADQIGSPTSTHSLTRFLFAILNSEMHPGVYHWSDGGEISWHEFSTAIQAAGLEQGLLHKEIPLNRLNTEQYPTAAKRPAYSVLDRSESLVLVDGQSAGWREELKGVIIRLAQAQNDNDKE